MQITITEALVKLKTLDNRIQRAVSVLNPVTVVTGKNSPRGFNTTVEFEGKAKADFKSAQDLIKYRQTVKGAIVAANATTPVVIGGKTLTVAQAIERKNSIKYEKTLLSQISQNYASILRHQISLDMEAEKKLETQLLAVLGKDVKSRDSSEAEAQTKLFWDNNKPRIIDPLDSKKLIESLEKDITEFEGEVDFRLSEANAMTKIEVPE